MAAKNEVPQTAGVTRLKKWPKSVKPEDQPKEKAAKAEADAVADQNAEAAAQAAADAGSSAPHPHAPGYEAERLDADGNPPAAPAEGATTEDAG